MPMSTPAASAPIATVPRQSAENPAVESAASIASAQDLGHSDRQTDIDREAPENARSRWSRQVPISGCHAKARSASTSVALRRPHGVSCPDGGRDIMWGRKDREQPARDGGALSATAGHNWTTVL